MEAYEVLILSAAKRVILAMDPQIRTVTARCLRAELGVAHPADTPVLFGGIWYTVRPLSNGWSAVFRHVDFDEFPASGRSRFRRSSGTAIAVLDLLSAEEAMGSAGPFRPRTR